MTNKTDYTDVEERCAPRPGNPTAVELVEKGINALMKSLAESDESFRDLCGNVRSLARDVETLRTELRSLDSRPRTFAMSPNVSEAYELGVARGKELALERPGREAR